MSKYLEKFIKESLEKEIPPKLSSFFAAKVTNKIKLEKKTYPIKSLFLWSYWCLFSFFTIFMFSNLNWASWIGVVVLITLIPISFILPSIYQSYE